MEIVTRVLYDAIYHTTPILLSVLGGLFAYKAGVLNIALEGMMMLGAFISVFVAMSTQNVFIIYVVSIIAVLAVGLVFSLFAVELKGNVIIIGLAINMLIPAIASFILQYLHVPNLTAAWVNPMDLRISIPIINQIPFVGDVLSGHPLGTYIALISIVAVSVLMYKTKFGIYARVVGESPHAARSLGISTKKISILAVLLGAFFSAIAGLNLSFERLGIYTNGMSAGRGFIAIAAIYCGKGDPLKSSIYAFIFGIARSLAINLSIYAGNVSSLLNTLPYLLMIIILAINSYVSNRNNKTRTYW